MNTARYLSPLGGLLLAGDDAGLAGAWFRDGKYFAPGLGPDARPGRFPALDETCRWLDRYFAGYDPGPVPPLHLTGTPFRLAVWQALLEIPYGRTTTYGALAGLVAARLGKARMSAQAVGGAVGHNPVCVIIPCHRVLGAGGALTGYAGGLDRKTALLALEGIPFRAEK